MPARRSAVLAAWLAFLLACALVISRAPFVADMSAFLPASPDPAQQLLIEQIQQGAPSRTVLVGITGGDAAQRAEASRALARELRASSSRCRTASATPGVMRASGSSITATS
jgi:predicted exporter